MASNNGSVPKRLVGWYQYSRPNWRAVPKHRLTIPELKFFDWLLRHPERKAWYPLYTGEEVAFKLQALWSDLVGELSSAVLAKHLRRGRSYAERAYYDSSGRYKGSLWLFSKGLIRGYKQPTKHGYRILYGYPRERYRLVAKNFVSPYPLHQEFAEWSFQQFWAGLAEDSMYKVRNELLELALWDGSGNYTADNCYRVIVDGRTTYYWFEIHTGSEGYDEKMFIPRLLTAELRLRGRGKYIVIVPFGKDVDKARKAIKEYNEKQSVQQGEKPKLELKLTKIIHYR